MNAFNVMLRGRTSGASITVARRHKRRITIIDKLYREPGIQLSRMDDVAGMRLSFHDKKSLLSFRADFLKSKHNHKRRNDEDKYNYLLNRKSPAIGAYMTFIHIPRPAISTAIAM
jgi:putative GTP pyrophosphokinase